MNELSPADLATTEPSARKPRLRLFVRKILIALFTLGLLASANAVLLPLRSYGGFYEIFATAAFFSRVFLLPMAIGWLLLAGVSYFFRLRKIALAGMLLAAAWAAPELWMAWPRTPAVDGPVFSLASFNLNKDLQDATWAGRAMLQMDADFIVLQELSPHAADQLRAALAERYPYAELYPDVYFNGMGVFSKTPLKLRHAPESFERRDLGVLATSNGHEFVLIDMHLAPPQQAEKRRRNRWQTKFFIDQLAAEPLPVMLAGDYNCTAMTPQAFALRSAGFVDAHLQAGRGRQSTWPAPSVHAWLPTVRIDTVYARGPLRAVASEVGPDIGSDHLPIKTTWCWSPR